MDTQVGERGSFLYFDFTVRHLFGILFLCPYLRLRGGVTIKSILKNIKIVLVEPQSPGNVGSVARVMANTGIKKMVLVNPCELSPDGDGYAMACKASPLIERAQVVETLSEAVESSVLVAATTRRRGKLRYPTMTLSEATEKIVAATSGGNVSIVFGREDKGLTREEVAECGMVLEIPTDSGYPSLNLSHAVFAVCHAIFTATTPEEEDLYGDSAAVTMKELNGMYEHLESMLRALDYGDASSDSNPDEVLLKAIMHNFKRLFGRTTVMERELNMLRGIFKRMEGRL
ncbi:MAG: RNA methyltransferase [Deltaproteobacteria bacterium]|nr:RNA methyltransferase [Deltaproteobacteria bacterium]